MAALSCTCVAHFSHESYVSVGRQQMFAWLACSLLTTSVTPAHGGVCLQACASSLHLINQTYLNAASLNQVAETNCVELQANARLASLMVTRDNTAERIPDGAIQPAASSTIL